MSARLEDTALRANAPDAPFASAPGGRDRERYGQAHDRHRSGEQENHQSVSMLFVTSPDNSGGFRTVEPPGNSSGARNAAT
jgi:hypothetical protein